MVERLPSALAASISVCGTFGSPAPVPLLAPPPPLLQAPTMTAAPTASTISRRKPRIMVTRSSSSVRAPTNVGDWPKLRARVVTAAGSKRVDGPRPVARISPLGDTLRQECDRFVNAGYGFRA